MARLTNKTRQTIDLVVKGKPNKDGAPPTVSLAPGETRDIDGVVENAAYRGKVKAGSLVVETVRDRVPQPSPVAATTKE